MQHFFELIHADTYCVFWLFYLGYIFITGYSGILNKRWWEILGAASLLFGIFYPPLTLIPLIWLLPLSIITIYRHFDHNTLYRCVIPVLLVTMNRTYGII